MTPIPLILASSSPRRKDLLEKIGIIPDHIISPDINEAPLPGELGNQLALRLSKSKVEAVADCLKSGFILAADTVVAAGRRILPKAENDAEVRRCLELLSGRRHRVYTGVCLIKKDNEQIKLSSKLVQTIVKFKHLTNAEIDLYLSSKEGIGKAGGYSIQGFSEAFMPFISGSYSNVVGLPLFEVRNMLISAGYIK